MGKNKENHWKTLENNMEKLWEKNEKTGYYWWFDW